MSELSKQDRVYTRTPSGLERKYNYGRVIEEITGVKLTLEEQEALVKAELSLKLGYDDNDQIVSMLNASANIITIRGNRLTIESDHFELEEDGTIHATAGNIGGCVIKNGVLQVPAAHITGKLTADQINTGSFTAKLEEIEDRIESAEGTLSQTNTSLSVLSGQIESKVSQTEFDTLGNTVNSHETRITQTEKDITLKVSQTEFDALGNRVSSAESSIEVLPNQILSTVSETYATQDALATGISSAESKITQTASEIRAECKATYATQDQVFGVADFEARLVSAESSITQMPNQILSEVSATYATKEEIYGIADLEDRLIAAESSISQMPDQITATVSATYATKDSLGAYATTESLGAYATKDSLSGYATTQQLIETETKITQSKTEILASVSGTYVTQTDAATAYATKNELGAVSGELALKIGVNDSNQIVSMLNVATDEIHIKTELFHLDGDKTYIRDGMVAMEYMEAKEVIFGNGPWLLVNSDGVHLTTTGYTDDNPELTITTQYDANIDDYIPVITADRININANTVNFSKSVQVYGRWTISANSLDYYVDANTYLYFTVGGVSGSATGGKLISWAKLYNLVNS